MEELKTRFENKETALEALVLHDFKVGEIYAVSYRSETWDETTNPNSYDILVAVGVADGMGNDHFRICNEKGVNLYTKIGFDLTVDVSEIAADETYLVRYTEDNQLVELTRGEDTPGEPYIKKRVLEKGANGFAVSAEDDIFYIYSAPLLVNPVEVACRPSIDGITFEDGELSIKIDTGTEVYEDLHFVDAEEKAYLVETLFDKNFQLTVTGQKLDKTNGYTTSTDPCIVCSSVFTLKATYSGTGVDLDSCPFGYGEDDDPTTKGVYKVIQQGNTSQSSPSGKTATYTKANYTGQKTIPVASTHVDHWWNIVYGKTLPSLDGILNDATDDKLVSSVLGTYKVTPPQDEYVWFVIPESLKPTKITQFGVNYVDSDILAPEDIKKNSISLGGYRIYRSLNTGNGLEQTVVIS